MRSYSWLALVALGLGLTYLGWLGCEWRADPAPSWVKYRTVEKFLVSCLWMGPLLAVFAVVWRIRRDRFSD